MSQNQRDYEVGRGKPRCTADSRRASPATRAGPRPKNLPGIPGYGAHPVVVTIAGERRSPRASWGNRSRARRA